MAKRFLTEFSSASENVQDCGGYQRNWNFPSSASSPCNGGSDISVEDFDSYRLTGIPADCPNLTLEQFIRTTPSFLKLNQNKMSCLRGSSSCSQTRSCKSKVKEQNSLENYRSSRRNVKPIVYNRTATQPERLQDISSISKSPDFYAKSSYQYLPTCYTSIHRDPSGYYSNMQTNPYGGNYSLKQEDMPMQSDNKSTDEAEAMLSESSLVSESASNVSDAERMGCDTSKSSEGVSSPSNDRDVSDGFEATGDDSGIQDTDIVFKSEVSDSESLGKYQSCLLEDEGLIIGPPILFMGHTDSPPYRSLDALSKHKNTIFYCVACVKASPGCQSIKEETDNLQNDQISPAVHDTDQSEQMQVCESGQGCEQHCQEQSLLTLTVSEKDSHLCFGCHKPVFDRYVLHVKDHGYWHADCLKCSNCQDNLSTQKTCYVKNEQVFCRNDYNILFGLSCVKCSLQFKKEQDWMRVAGQHRYHIACFLCKICKRQLGNNEKYHLVNGTDIYCTNHYRDMVNGDNSDGQQPPKKAKRNRTSYTETQIKFLQDRFLRDSNPDGGELEKIAKHIGLKKRVVQVWFQNNRARLKKSANNNKGSNQENKNPSTSNGITGPGSMHDFQSIDWDNSMEPKSLDEQSYSNSPTHSHTRPGSTHFLDSGYSMASGLSSSITTPLMCMPPGHGATSTLGNGPSSLGEGSGSGGSNCETPRDQESPQFSDLSTPVLTAAGDSSTEDLPASSYHDFSSLGCPGGSGTRHIPLLSALKSTVMGAGLDKFTDSLALRGETQDPPQSSGRLFHDGALSRPLHHSESAFSSSHLGLYAGFYNSNMYHSRESLLGDPAVGAEGFLRHRDPQSMSYLGANQNSMFGHDPTSGPLRGQDSPQFPQLFNYLSGYGRSSCPSPPLPRSQGQFLNTNAGCRNKGTSFFNDTSDSV